MVKKSPTIEPVVMPKDYRVLSVILPAPLRGQLEQLAAARGTGPSTIAREVLDDYVRALAEPPVYAAPVKDRVE